MARIALRVGEAPECRLENLARGEWLCSRVYSVLGRAEAALWHAQRCLDHCEAAGIGDWDLAYAYEALARASSGTRSAPRHGVSRRGLRATRRRSEDREHFDQDFATL
jgi:hypothetical protein